MPPEKESKILIKKLCLAVSLSLKNKPSRADGREADRKGA
jgi:hypothetical protein